MLLEALVALSGWVLTAPPAGTALQRATEFEGRQVSYYGRETRDPEDSPLVLTTYQPGASPYPAPPAAQTTVHGVPAEFSDLTDDGQTYGREVRWIEPSGVTLTIGLDGKPSDGALRTLAESVQAVPPERWQALVTATSSAPQRPPAGSRPVVVGRRQGWSLTALLPPGFPVAPEDRRAPCFRLSYRGARNAECDEPAAWRRVGGRIFVFGSVPARVKRVRVHALGVTRVTTRTVAAPGYPLARFYAVRLPSNTCQVRVADGRGREISPTGPAAGGPAADRRRCGVTPPGR